MTILLIFNVIAGLVLAGISVPLIRRKIGPNPFYGFRVRKTLSNPEVWYAANAYAAKWLFGIGLGTVAVAVALFFVPGIDVLGYSLTCAALILGGLVVGLVMSFRYLNRLPA
jgi:hypothetical protein